MTQQGIHVQPRSSLELITRGDTESIASQYDSFILNAELYGSPATATDYKYKLRYFVRYCSAHNILHTADVTSDFIKSYLFQLKGSVSPKSQNGYCKVLRRFFNWLMEEGRLKSSPMLYVKSPKVPETIVRIFTPEHLQIILLLCHDNTRTSVRNRAMVLVLLDTGIRRKELAGMKLVDVDVKTGDIYVMGKGNRERVVRICKATLKSLVDYCRVRRGDYPQLWLSEEGKPLTVGGISMIFKVLKKRANFNDVRLSPHTFRHTNGTMEMFNGASERQVQMQLGHRTSAMTRHYTAAVTSAAYLEKHKDFSPVAKLGLK